MQAIWKIIARQCAKPKVRAAIIRLAQRTPYFDIYNGDLLYMRRWWLLPRWCLQPDENGVLMAKPWMPFSIRVHHIIRPDQDRHLHDHPFNFRSIVIDGWYTELSHAGKVIRDTGHTYYADSARWHQISEVAHEGAWSIFIMGRRINSWGFLVDGAKVPWQDYLGAKGMA